MRVLRYRQHKQDGTEIQADWLTNFSSARLATRFLCLLMNWLFLLLALVIERLFRNRYLHRGSHPVLTAMQLKDMLWLNLQPAGANTS